MLGDGSGTDKTNRANLRMIAESVDDIFAAVDEINDAFWEAGFFEKLVGRGSC